MIPAPLYPFAYLALKYSVQYIRKAIEEKNRK